MIAAIVVTSEGAIQEREIDESLASLQEIVGGYIQYVPLRDLEGALIVNEEGLLNGLDPNAIASGLTGKTIVGTAVVIGPPDEEGNETSVPEMTARAVRAIAGAEAEDEDTEDDEQEAELPGMTALEAAAVLREFADWLETNQEQIDKHRRIHGGIDSLNPILFYCSDPEEFAEAVKLLGKGEKNGDDSYFKVTRRFGPLSVQAYIVRETVCRKTTRTEWREVEVTDWECDEAILAHLPEPEEVES